MKPERYAPPVVALAIVVVSFAAILIRLCTVPTALIAAYRLTISSLLLLPFFVWKGRGRGVGFKQACLCFLAGVFLALHFLFWIESLKLTTVANSVMLVTTSPVFAAVFAWALLREGIGRKTLAAIGLCIAGSIIIGRSAVDFGPESLKGNILAILGAAAFGAQFVIARSLRQNMGFLAYVFLTYTAAALVLVGFALFRGHSFTGFETQNYLWLLLLALGPQVFGHSTLNWAIRYLQASKVAISVLGEPIGSAILAWIFFSEVPGYGLFLGGALILYGVYLALSERPPERGQVDA